MYVYISLYIYIEGRVHIDLSSQLNVHGWVLAALCFPGTSFLTATLVSSVVEGLVAGALPPRHPDVPQQERIGGEVPAAAELAPGAARNAPSYEGDLHVAVGDLGAVGPGLVDGAAVLVLLLPAALQAQDVAEHHAELLAEEAVEHEVERGVDGDEGGAEDVEQLVLHHPVVALLADDGHQDVVHDGGELADEEDDDHCHQHHRQVVLARGRRRHLLALVAGAVDGAEQGGVEQQDDDEWQQEHEGQLQGDGVDVLEEDVAPELRGPHAVLVLARLVVANRVRLVVEAARDVVQHGPQHDHQDGPLGARLGAHVARVQRPADGDEALDGEGDAGVDGAHLGRQAQRVGDGDDGHHVAVVDGHDGGQPAAQRRHVEEE